MSKGRLVAVMVASMVVATPSAHAAHAPAGEPAYPSIKRCDSAQTSYLKDAWKEAYRYTKRSEGLMRYLEAQPDFQARFLWAQDFIGYGPETDPRLAPSPERYFGPYSRSNLVKIRQTLTTARQRFEGKTIYRLACSTVCPKASAHHIVRGRIVTCPRFWSRARDTKVDLADRRLNSAFTLVHEVHHHITMTVNGVKRFIEDYHTDGAGPLPNRKYYGERNVTYLAQNAPHWAIRNNDTYAYFATWVDVSWYRQPDWHGVYRPKEPGGTGGFFADMTFTQLVAKHKELRTKGQYLADVESYIRHGQRLFSGLWRIGEGDAGFYATERSAVLQDWGKRKGTQNLIDIEYWTAGTGERLLAVYRSKPAGAGGDGGLFVDLTWDDLLAKRAAFGGSAYLADVESYLRPDGTRRYAAAWLVGPGNGSLYRTTDGPAFGDASKKANAAEQLIDYEEYPVGNGRIERMGVWRSKEALGLPASAVGSRMRAPFEDFVASWLKATDKTLIDVEEYSIVPMQS